MQDIKRMQLGSSVLRMTLLLKELFSPLIFAYLRLSGAYGFWERKGIFAQRRWGAECVS